MSTVTLDDLVKDFPRNTIPPIFLKHADVLPVVVREDGGGICHYFVYIPNDEQGEAHFRRLLIELLSENPHDVLLRPCQVRYWSRDGYASQLRDRHYAACSLFIGTGLGMLHRVSGSVHFFVSRESFNFASTYCKPIGFSDGD